MKSPTIIRFNHTSVLGKGYFSQVITIGLAVYYQEYSYDAERGNTQLIHSQYFSNEMDGIEHFNDQHVR